MARFLSPEWLDDLEMMLSDSSATRSAGNTMVAREPLAIRQVITGGPGGDTSFVVRVEHGRATLDRDSTAAADIEVRQDLQTATDIATGMLTPSAAFASGRMKLTGRVGLLAEHQASLAALGDPFLSLRATTSY